MTSFTLIRPQFSSCADCVIGNTTYPAGSFKTCSPSDCHPGSLFVGTTSWTVAVIGTVSLVCHTGSGMTHHSLVMHGRVRQRSHQCGIACPPPSVSLSLCHSLCVSLSFSLSSAAGCLHAPHYVIADVHNSDGSCDAIYIYILYLLFVYFKTGDLSWY